MCEECYWFHSLLPVSAPRTHNVVPSNHTHTSKVHARALATIMRAHHPLKAIVYAHASNAINVNQWVALALPLFPFALRPKGKLWQARCSRTAHLWVFPRWPCDSIEWLLFCINSLHSLHCYQLLSVRIFPKKMLERNANTRATKPEAWTAFVFFRARRVRVCACANVRTACVDF